VGGLGGGGGGGKVFGGLKFTTQILMMPRIRMSGAIRLLPLSAFMEWIGKTFIVGLHPQSPSVTSWSGLGNHL